MYTASDFPASQRYRFEKGQNYSAWAEKIALEAIRRLKAGEPAIRVFKFIGESRQDFARQSAAPNPERYGRLRTRGSVTHLSADKNDYLRLARRGLLTLTHSPLRGVEAICPSRLVRQTTVLAGDEFIATRIGQYLTHVKIGEREYGPHNIVLEHTPADTAQTSLHYVLDRLNAHPVERHELCFLQFVVFQAMPFERGSASICDIFFKAFVSAWRGERWVSEIRDLDLLAMTVLDFSEYETLSRLVY